MNKKLKRELGKKVPKRGASGEPNFGRHFNEIEPYALKRVLARVLEEKI